MEEIPKLTNELSIVNAAEGFPCCRLGLRVVYLDQAKGNRPIATYSDNEKATHQ